MNPPKFRETRIRFPPGHKYSAVHDGADGAGDPVERLRRALVPGEQRGLGVRELGLQRPQDFEDFVLGVAWDAVIWGILTTRGGIAVFFQPTNQPSYPFFRLIFEKFCKFGNHLGFDPGFPTIPANLREIFAKH